MFSDRALPAVRRGGAGRLPGHGRLSPTERVPGSPLWRRRNINADLDARITTVFLTPPRSMAEVTSSFVRGLVGTRGWEKVVAKYVPGSVYRAFLKKAKGS